MVSGYVAHTLCIQLLGVVVYIVYTAVRCSCYKTNTNGNIIYLVWLAPSSVGSLHDLLRTSLWGPASLPFSVWSTASRSHTHSLCWGLLQTTLNLFCQGSYSQCKVRIDVIIRSNLNFSEL